MLAPPVAAASSDINSPCLSAFERPMEKALVSESTLSHLFPNEFPYEFALTSPEDVTETEDEDDFLAGLTSRLALPSPPPIDEAKVCSKALLFSKCYLRLNSFAHLGSGEFD